jgi:hypothetical protein
VRNSRVLLRESGRVAILRIRTGEFFMTIDTKPILLRWLRGLPDATTIHWGDDGVTADHPYAKRAADPVVAVCPVAWPWHVVGSDEPQLSGSQSTTIRLDYELDIYEVWPWGPCQGPIGAWRVGHDRPLDVVTAAAVAELRALPGAMLVLSGGWLPATISSALTDWVAAHGNRSDLCFRWDPTQRSAVVQAFALYVRAGQAGGARAQSCIALRSAPAIDNPPLDDSVESRLEASEIRHRIRVATAMRWARRRLVDPELRWLTPAEARVLAGLGPIEDVLAWAVRRRVPIRPARGIEPVLASAPVLAFASAP